MTSPHRTWIFAPALLCALVTPVRAHGQATGVDGVLTAVWGDPHPSEPRAPELRWFITDDAGRTLGVQLDAAVVNRLGGVPAVDRRRVRATGRLAGVFDARDPTLYASTLQTVGAAAATSPQTGNRPFAILLCRFADIDDEPRTPAEMSALMGAGFPNVEHFYGEMSGGLLDFAGTSAYGWFVLPHAKADYFAAAAEATALGRLATDCTAAADSVVDFAQYAGIITQYNADLAEDGLGNAWGGSRALTLDGVSRVWPFAWMPHWATQSGRYGVYAHEIGHSLGLNHSSGPYTAVYDSNWDVMSNAYLRYDAALGAWLPGHTIVQHKYQLGWIAAQRRVTVTGPAPRTVTVEHSLNPAAGTGALLIVVPIPGTGDFYTVEARRQGGYDAGLPGSAVIIHRVPDPNGTSCTTNRCARIIDADNNGNPNDEGAMWLPGETFDDSLGIRIAVTAATPNGWTITVTPGNRLSVAGAGNAGGTVHTQGGAGIDCTITGANAAGTCLAAFYGNPMVTLTATAAEHAQFTGWSGACTGVGACVVALKDHAAVTATFTKVLVRPTGLTAQRATDAVLGRTTLTAEEIEYLDNLGNRNGRLDIGDVLALLAQEGR